MIKLNGSAIPPFNLFKELLTLKPSDDAVNRGYYFYVILQKHSGTSVSVLWWYTAPFQELWKAVSSFPAEVQWGKTTSWEFFGCPLSERLTKNLVSVPNALNVNKQTVQKLLLLRGGVSSICFNYKLKCGLLEEFSQRWEVTFSHWVQLWFLHSVTSVWTC